MPEFNHAYPGINVGLKHSDWRSKGNHPDAYEVCGGMIWRLLPVREVFMMTLMDRLTDKPGWHKKVFDEDIVSKWRKEALEQSEKQLFDEIVYRSRLSVRDGPDDRSHDAWVPFPRRQRLISEYAFDYCIRELRNKAAHFERTGLIPTLDSVGLAIAKSDTHVPDDLKHSLRKAFVQLQAEQKASNAVDWHPRTNEMVQDLVHPSMYPFVYGRSSFIQDEVVGVTDAISKWMGKGETAPAEPKASEGYGHLEKYSSGDTNDPWSQKYQWLPANLIFQEDGSVKFSSYVNNLHPNKHGETYAALEKLIDLAIPAWDQVLGQCGRAGDDSSRFSLPVSAHDEETEGLWEPLDPELLTESGIEPNKDDLDDIKNQYEYHDEDYHDENKGPKPENIQNWKWKQIRDAILPEPNDGTTINYAPCESLRERFKESGLQVIVKMARIELTLEKPEFPAGGWHVEGMCNERICATALYYLDSENVTTNSLAFRVETERDQEKLMYAAGQDAYHWLECVYGANFRDDLSLQYFGQVETREGRMLAFPNVFQHRVTPFSLKDRTKPGHRSFVALWLVDPTQRIVNTGNVPPQQLDWWAESVFGASGRDTNTGDMPADVVRLLREKQGLAEKLTSSGAKTTTQKGKLPNELLDIVRQDGGIALNGVMSLDEAKEHRIKLMEERSVWESGNNEATGVESYSFCEH